MEENSSNDGGDEKCMCLCNDKKIAFPPGYRFNPTDEELVVNYLKKKLMNERLAYRATMKHKILELNIYNLKNPEKLATDYKLTNGEKHWYFFTQSDRKYPNGERPNRTTGEGYWKATGVDQAIKSDEGTVGYKKALVFYYKGNGQKSKKTNWIMHEFRCNIPARKRTSSGDMKLDWVLSRIYKRSESNKSESNDDDVVTTVAKEERAPDESALEANAINEGGNHAENDQLLISRDENGFIRMSHHMHQQQQQHQPLHQTVSAFSRGSLVGNNAPQTNIPAQYYPNFNDAQQHEPPLDANPINEGGNHAENDRLLISTDENGFITMSHHMQQQQQQHQPFPTDSYMYPNFNDAQQHEPTLDANPINAEIDGQLITTDENDLIIMSRHHHMQQQQQQPLHPYNYIYQTQHQQQQQPPHPHSYIYQTQQQQQQQPLHPHSYMYQTQQQQQQQPLHPHSYMYQTLPPFSSGSLVENVPQTNMNFDQNGPSH